LAGTGSAGEIQFDRPVFRRRRTQGGIPCPLKASVWILGGPPGTLKSNCSEFLEAQGPRVHFIAGV